MRLQHFAGKHEEAGLILEAVKYLRIAGGGRQSKDQNAQGDTSPSQLNAALEVDDTVSHSREYVHHLAMVLSKQGQCRICGSPQELEADVH